MADDYMSDPVYVEVVKARVKLLFEKPFFGQLASRLQLVLTDDASWCRTMATDGRRLYMNRTFVKKLSKPELLFAIGHNVLHCVYDHLGRRQGRDPKLWDMANDYIANYTLKAENVGQMPPEGLYDTKYTDEMTSEQVYDDLKKNSVTIKMPLDQHLDHSSEADEDENSVEVTITNAGGDGPPKLTSEDLARIRNELKAALIQTAQSLKPGQVPAGIRRMISDLTEPKMDWRSLLCQFLKVSAAKDDYTFQRISRRSWGSQCILPAQGLGEAVEVFVTIDTSGSMTEEMLRDFLSEVKGIMETFSDFKLILCTFDSKCYDFHYFDPSNIHDIDRFVPEGGGGTSPHVVWDKLKEEGIEPDCIVCFTDGYVGDDWGDPSYADALFVIHGSNSIVASHGITAYYDEA